MSSASMTPSRPLPALIDPIARRARAAEQARVLRQSVTAAVLEARLAYANASARVSVIEAEIDALLVQRGHRGLAP